MSQGPRSKSPGSKLQVDTYLANCLSTKTCVLEYLVEGVLGYWVSVCVLYDSRKKKRLKLVKYDPRLRRSTTRAVGVRVLHDPRSRPKMEELAGPFLQLPPVCKSPPFFFVRLLWLWLPYLYSWAVFQKSSVYLYPRLAIKRVFEPLLVNVENLTRLAFSKYDVKAELPFRRANVHWHNMFDYEYDFHTLLVGLGYDAETTLQDYGFAEGGMEWRPRSSTV